MQELAAAFLRDVESEQVSPHVAMAHRICGMTLWFESNFVEARSHLEQVLTIGDAAQDREFVFRYNLDVISTVMAVLPLVLWPLGVLDRADGLNKRFR